MFSCYLLFLFAFIPLSYSIKKYEIPDIIVVGGITLKLNKGIKSQLQAQITKALKKENQLQDNLSTIGIYLPIIEEILVAEGLPSDYKYLAINENHLITKPSDFFDVAFWKTQEQFTEEMEFIIDEKIDERFHIINSTKKAARYLRRNNLYFKNWLFNLLSLELGFEESKKYVLQNYKRSDIVGVQQFEIDENINPIIRNFLFRKILINRFMSENTDLQLKLIQYTQGANKTLSQVARKFDVPLNELEIHNKWLKKRKIPNDKVYAVIIPSKEGTSKTISQDKSDTNDEPQPLSEEEFVKPLVSEEGSAQESESLIDNQQEKRIVNIVFDLDNQNKQNYQITTTENQNNSIADEKPLTHTVLKNQTLFSIARMYQVSLLTIRELNNMKFVDKIYPGQVLRISEPSFVKESTNNIEQNNSSYIHTVQEGESLFMIAQKYQISMADLRIWNQLDYNNYSIRVGDRLIVGQQNRNRGRVLKSGNQETNKTFQQKILKGKTIQKLSETPEGTMRGDSPKKKDFLKEKK